MARQPRDRIGRFASTSGGGAGSAKKSYGPASLKQDQALLSKIASRNSGGFSLGSIGQMSSVNRIAQRISKATGQKPQAILESAFGKK